MLLRKEPMPRHVSPMLAVLASALPADTGGYGFEYKWDGYRILCFWNGRNIRFQSRNLLDVSGKMKEFSVLGQELGREPLILDGELIALTPGGRPSFQLLQRRFGAKQAGSEKIPLLYVIFDLLYWKEYWTGRLPFEERRRLLDQFALEGPLWKISPLSRSEPHRFMEAARAHGMEGLIAKKLSGLYRHGVRSGDWLKIKLVMRQEFVIGGWSPGEGVLEGSLGSLLVGYYEEGGKRLRYAGSVGTGLLDEDRLLLKQYLEQRRFAHNPFSEPVSQRRAVFALPELVAEVEFRGWTFGGKLRQASFKGIRFDKEARSIVRERPAA